MRLDTALVGVASVASLVAAQETFRGGVDVVRIAATVIDRDGRLVPGLTKDDFVVEDAGKEQPIVVFAADAQPVSVAVVLDISGSMRGRAYAQAVDAFTRIAAGLGASDEIMACVFEAETSCSEWTRDVDAAATVLRDIRPQGESRLYDGLDRVLRRLEQARHPKRSLVLISDGEVGGLQRTDRDARNAIRRSEVPTYAIAIAPAPRPGPPAVEPPRSAERSGEANLSTLRDLTDITGGRTFAAQTSGAVSEAAASVTAELRHQYQLGYVMPRPPDGKYHEMKVRARHGNYDVRARRGYIARVPPKS